MNFLVVGFSIWQKLLWKNILSQIPFLLKKKVINGILIFRIAKNHHNCLQYGSELNIFHFHNLII